MQRHEYFIYPLLKNARIIYYDFFKTKMVHFKKYERRYMGTLLFSKIGQSFNEHNLRSLKNKMNLDNQYKHNSIVGKSQSGSKSVFQNFIDLFNKKNIKDKFDFMNNEKQEKEFFNYYVKCLMKYEGIFTFEKFQWFLKDLCDYFGILGIKYKLKKKSNPQFEKLKKQYEVLQNLLPYELESDDYRIFHHESKKYLAQSCNVDIDFIEELLLMHDSLKTDRTWYFRRQIFKRKPIESFEEREIESTYDRPIIKTFNYNIKEPSLEYEISMKKQGRKYKFKTWFSKQHPWFRKNTSGKDRWRIRPYTKKFPYLYYSKIPRHLYLSRNPPFIRKLS